ncbi:MAG: hypothetical protein OXFUSZZB_001037 [Candidatus Fervidibacter sp.]
MTIVLSLAALAARSTIWATSAAVKWEAARGALDGKLGAEVGKCPPPQPQSANIRTPTQPTLLPIPIASITG